MKIQLQVCAALALAGIAQGQTKPTDVGGWGKVKWGMTLTEAKAAYGPALHDLVAPSQRSSEHSIERLEVDGLSVGDISMHASLFTEPGSDRIKEANLQVPDIHKANGAFQVLLDAMTQKYGKPTRQDSTVDPGTGNTKTATWIFPSTVIRLDDMHFDAVESDIVNLDYSAVNKKAQDAL
jgi:hypothetical protein